MTEVAHSMVKFKNSWILPCLFRHEQSKNWMLSNLSTITPTAGISLIMDQWHQMFAGRYPDSERWPSKRERTSTIKPESLYYACLFVCLHISHTVDALVTIITACVMDDDSQYIDCNGRNHAAGCHLGNVEVCIFWAFLDWYVTIAKHGIWLIDQLNEYI